MLGKCRGIPNGITMGKMEYSASIRQGAVFLFTRFAFFIGKSRKWQGGEKCMKSVPVQQAVGMVLCHDITEIIPGERKGRAFRKGHVVCQEDVPRLLNLGKEHLYIWEINEFNCHEDTAAIRIAEAISGQGIHLTEPSEGKVELKASRPGLLKINLEALTEINSIDEIVIATIHSNQIVDSNKTLSGCRVVPLVVDAEKVKMVEKLSRKYYPIVEVKPLQAFRVGIVTTGSEVYHGRIQDKFGPVVTAKIEGYGSSVFRQIIADDNTEMIASAIKELILEGADMIVTTGGMSVDPDDVTPAGIRQAGGSVITYGAPVLPGSMFMLADIGGIPVLGLPGCVMYSRTTIFDLVLPRILAGEAVTRKDIVRLAHGGLCTGCDPCRYPNCSFGKGF